MIRPHRLQEARLLIVLGEPVPGAGDNAEELGQRQREVDELGDEEEEDRLGEVAEDSGDRDGHPCNVGERVTDKHFGGAPVVVKEAEGSSHKWEDHIEAQLVRKDTAGTIMKLDGVVDDDEEGDHDGLPCLNPVDAGVDVDRVGAEDGDAGNDGVVENAEMNNSDFAGDVGDAGNENVRGSVVGNEKRERGKSRKGYLVTPADIQDIVGEAEEKHEADGKNPRVVLTELENNAIIGSFEGKEGGRRKKFAQQKNIFKIQKREKREEWDWNSNWD